MRRIVAEDKRLCLFLSLLATLVAWNPLTAGFCNPPNASENSAQALLERKILFLRSYGYGREGPESYNRRFFGVLEDHEMSSDDVMLEYLDLNRNRDAEYRARKRELLLHQYLGKQIDLIVAVEQPALIFLLEELKDLAPGVPVMVINATVPEALPASGRHFLQRTVNLDFKGTLERALELFPKTRRVVVVTGTAEQDLVVKNESMQTAALWQGKLEFEYTDHLSMDEILQRLSNLPPLTIVVYRAINRDATGEIFVPFDALLEITGAASAPVFGLYNNYIGTTGVVGGSVYHITREAESAALMALAIMNGQMKLTEPVTSLPSKGIPMFDWEQISRWGGDPSQLPLGAIFVNRSPTLWEQHRSTVILAFSVFIALSAFVLILLVENRRRRGAENALRESEEKLRSILGAAPIGIGLVVNRIIMEANDGLCTMTGYSRDELLERSARVLYPTDEEYDWVGKEKYRQISEMGTGTVETRWRRKDGTLVEILLSSTPTRRGDPSCGVTFTALDITERKLAESKLEDQNRFLQTLMDAIPIPVFYKGLDGVYLGCNKSYGTFLGLSKADVIGKGVHQIFPVGVADLYHRKDAELFRQPGVQHYEATMPRGDGTIRNVLITKATYKGENDRVAGLIGAMLDITERKRAEEALRASEEKWRNVLVNIPQIGISLDSEAHIIFANAYFLEMTGWRAEEILGRDWCDLFIPEDIREEIRGVFSSVISGHNTLGYSTYENQILTRSGERRTVAWSNVLTKDADGAVVDVTCLGHDLTERRRIMEALRRAESEKAAILEGMTDVVVEYVDPDMRIIWTNAAMPESFGAPNESLVGKHCYEVVQGRSSPCVNCTAVKAYQTGSPEEGEVTSHDGQSWMVRSNPLKDEEGHITGIVHVATNISKLKRTEEALRESEYKYRELFEAGSDAVLFVDNDTGLVLQANRAASAMFGYSHEELLRKRNWELSEEPEETLRVIQGATTTPGQVITVPLRYLRKKDGTVFPAEITGRSFFWQNCSVFIASIRDITERKQAEDTRRLHFAVMEVVSEGLILVGWEDYLIKWTNQKSEEMFGYDLGEMIGMPVDRINAPTDKTPSETRASIIDALNETGEWHGEIQNIKKDGTVFWSYARVSLFDHPDYGKVTVSARTDITDRKRAEEEKEKLETQFRHAQKMEAVGTLAGGIAHDFNNILAPIIGYTEMVMGELPESAPMHSDLEQVLRAAHRARELVRQILAFSHHGQDQKRVPVDVGSILKEALKLMKASLPSSIEIQESIQKGMALANATQIHQVLVNLCTNASHAMEEKGVLGVSLSNVNLTEFDVARLPAMDLKPGSYLKLSVSDTGHGMDEETMQRIYDPYFTTKKVGKGTGLGLAVVHGIVERHEGAVSVTSEIGKGTTFDVYLPRVEPEWVDPERKTRDLPRGMERILIVDDEQMVADLGSRILAQLGYEVTRETNPVIALDTFTRNPDAFDLIITDYTMPHITGTELAGEILKIRPGMPILLCTGYSEKGTETAARELGIRGYAMKPLDRAQLAQLVRKALDERNYP